MLRTAISVRFVGLITAGRAWHGTGPSAPARAPPAPPPRPLALPGPAGCTLRAAKSSVGVTLEIAPGVPYARVAQIGSMEVTLPIGRDAPAAGVAVAAGNVKLKGLATPSGLALYPARPFVISEVLVPGPHSRLRWGEVAADRVAVEVELAKESRTEFRDVKGPLRASRAVRRSAPDQPGQLRQLRRLRRARVRSGRGPEVVVARADRRPAERPARWRSWSSTARPPSTR